MYTEQSLNSIDRRHRAYTEDRAREIALRQTQPDFTSRFHMQPQAKQQVGRDLCMQSGPFSSRSVFFEPKILFGLPCAPSPVVHIDILRNLSESLSSTLTLRLTRTRAHVDVAHETYARRASHVMQCSWHPWQHLHQHAGPWGRAYEYYKGRQRWWQRPEVCARLGQHL